MLFKMDLLINRNGKEENKKTTCIPKYMISWGKVSTCFMHIWSATAIPLSAFALSSGVADADIHFKHLVWYVNADDTVGKQETNYIHIKKNIELSDLSRACTLLWLVYFLQTRDRHIIVFTVFTRSYIENTREDTMGTKANQRTILWERL